MRFHIRVARHDPTNPHGGPAGLGKLPAITPIRRAKINAQGAGGIPPRLFHLKGKTNLVPVKCLPEKLFGGLAIHPIRRNQQRRLQMCLTRPDTGAITTNVLSGEINRTCFNGHIHQMCIKLTTHGKMQRRRINACPKILAKGMKGNLAALFKRHTGQRAREYLCKLPDSPPGQPATAQLVPGKARLVNQGNTQPCSGGTSCRRCARRTGPQNDQVECLPGLATHRTVTFVPSGTRS